MVDVTVACGCGRKMGIDTLHGKGAYRCGCGVRVIVTIPAKAPTCIGQTKDGLRCPCRPAPDSREQGIGLCEGHLMEFRAYRATVDQANMVARQRLAEDAGLRSTVAAEESESRRRRAEQTVVYYVRIQGQIKIGTSSDLDTRLKTLLIDELLAVEPGSFDLEAMRHKQFAHLRLRGERFAPEPELMSHIEMIRSHFGGPREWTRGRAGRL